MPFELWWSRDLRKWVLSVVMTLGVVLACFPWGWRNYATFHEVFFIRSNLGLELGMPNHEGAAAAMEVMDARQEPRHRPTPPATRCRHCKRLKSNRALKVDTRQSIEQERRGAACFENLIGPDAAVKPDPSDSTDTSGLIYNHARGMSFEDAQNAPDLEEVFLQRPIAESAVALDHLYAFARQRVHNPANLRLHEDALLGQVYAAPDYDYLRTGKAATPAEEASVRVAVVVGTRTRLFGRPIVHPNTALWALKKRCLDVTVGPVHGDLHPRNVIFAPKHDAPHVLDLKTPHLIDFKWSRPNGPVLVDYVLMEVTLRFLWVPRCFDPAEAAAINWDLLDEKGVMRRRRCRYEPHAKHVERLKVLIPVIRQYAKEVTNKADWFTEYLCSSFLLLHGLLLYPDYDARSATHALGIIGWRLSKEGVIKRP